MTGQHFDSIPAEVGRPTATSHGLEIAQNIYNVDESLRTASGLDIAQVEVGSILDAGNDERKEQGMMQLINHFMHTLTRYLASVDKHIEDLDVADYRRLNKKLQTLNSFTYITTAPGPKQVCAAKMDYILPPLSMLVDEGIIIDDKVRALRNSFNRKWSGISLPQSRQASE